MKDKKEMRRRMFDEMEQKLKETYSEEERMFYYHPSGERVVLSHAMFWVLSGTLRGKIRQEKYLLLLRQYEDEMQDAFLQELVDKEMKR